MSKIRPFSAIKLLHVEAQDVRDHEDDCVDRVMVRTDLKFGKVEASVFWVYDIDARAMALHHFGIDEETQETYRAILAHVGLTAPNRLMHRPDLVVIGSGAIRHVSAAALNAFKTHFLGAGDRVEWALDRSGRNSFFKKPSLEISREEMYENAIFSVAA